MATRLSKSGQPVMGTTIEVAMEIDDGAVEADPTLIPEWEAAGCTVDLAASLVWLPVKVVGKLCGKGGSTDLRYLIVEDASGGRQRIENDRGYVWRTVA